MITGAYSKGKEILPRVLHITIARYNKVLPKSGESLKFLVSVHEEGTGITWQQNVSISRKTERFFLDITRQLFLWSIDEALTPKTARNKVKQLGARLYQSFLGEAGSKVLESVTPTAILLNVDETILNLPWELIGTGGQSIAQDTPFGRLVSTRIIPRRSRDPLVEDNVVRILVVANPTLDLTGGDEEVKMLQGLAGDRGSYKIEVVVLSREKATIPAFTQTVENGNFDIIHFSGHGRFEPDAPETSSVSFADGLFTADDVLSLKWKSPPYIVFNSACESGKAAGGKRLVSGKKHSNGLAAAFIAAGVSAYAGYYWPVTDTGAAIFTEEFYQSLFMRENVGIAFLEARRRVSWELGESADLTGYSAVLYGDAASAHRRDLAKAI